MSLYNVVYWEQKYFDLWSIIHFNSGVVFGFLCVLLQLPVVQSLIIMFVLASLWEIAETIKFPKGLREPLTNQITDVFVALFGIYLVFYTIPVYFADTEVMYTFMCLYSIFAGLLALVGKRAIDAYSKDIT